MYLKELTINGFKSFAKKSELEFSTPITAIVGPNGSGKSNVAESFRFVLGEQSPSKMRGKKGEDLIWGGSDGVARSNRASVSIVLDNEKRLFPLDFDEVRIERVVNRDGQNEYFVNGSRARLKDIQEILAAANIGPTGHHIISQGEADRILAANPRERREMIEDALGLKVYQYKKAESEKKLAKTLENIAHVESLRREAAPHLKFLERQVKKAEKALQVREELEGAYAEYLKRKEVYIEEYSKKLAEDAREPAARRETLRSELADAKEKLKSAAKDQKRDELVALEERISSVRTRRQDALRQSGKIEGQIQFLEGRIAESSKQEEAAPIPYAEVERVSGVIEETVDAVSGSTDLDVLRRTLREVLGTVKTLLRQEFSAPDTSREEEELARLRKEKVVLDGEVAEIADAEEKLEEEYESLRASIESEDSKSREAERAVFRIMNEQRDVEEALAKIAEAERVIEREREELQRELKEAVALIGSKASAYQHVVVDVAEVLGEDRDRQRERRRALEKLKIRLEELGSGTGEDVLKEYKNAKERDEFLEREIADLHASVEKLQALIKDLNDQLNERFVSGIEKIDAEFHKFFELMFGGGAAKLVRVKPKRREDDEEDEEELEEGIEIDVRLPNKRVRGLDMLSGGERALTSIALIFAMSQVNPPLFVILDETDAALDEANSRRYGDMIESLAKRSQLILITHNRETMGRAGVLYGVTMGNDGVSKLLSVKFDEAVAVAK